MDIYICVGSACHLKGSYDVIKKFQKNIENSPDCEITLKSSFCLGSCSDFVSVKINGEIYSVSPETAGNFIKKIIKDNCRRK